MKIKDRRPECYNSRNERIKVNYRTHIRRVGQKDEKTIIAAIRHIRDFEVFIDFKGFEAFNDEIADKYIQSMFKADLSLSYITDNIRALKDFLKWLERQRGFRSKIDYNHIDYLNISRNQSKTAKAQSYQKAYKYEQIIEAIRLMPSNTDKDKRDKAIISLQALCTLRVSELRTVKIGSIIEEDGIWFVHINPKQMQTKFAKTRHVVFIPLPDDIKANLIDWREYLISLGFRDHDTIFPVIDNKFNTRNLLETHIGNVGIKSGTTIRDIFKRMFENADLEYINPHSFRKTLARYAQKQSPEFMNAARQNLGHSSIDTTLNSYGQLSDYDQRKVINEAHID